jgi:hypothetical protein
MSYKTIKDFIQEKLPEYKVTDELMYDGSANKAIIIRSLLGNIYKTSQKYPILLEIYTNDVDKTKIDMEVFSKAYNDTVIYDDQSNYIKMFYSNAIVVNNFNPTGNNFISVMQMQATLIYSMNICDILDVYIDNVKQETLSRVVSYSTALDNQRTNGEINQSYKNSAIVGLQITLLNKNNKFCEDLSSIRLGAISGNTQFTCKLVYTDGHEESYIMIVDSLSIQSSNGNLPLLNVSLKV